MAYQKRYFDEGPIWFYNRDEPYYAFTNFYPAPIIVDGKQWPTTEHYFQAQKFIGTLFAEVIRNFQRPQEAFDLSRNPAVSRWHRKDWEEVKVDIMRKALLAKFTQHRDLRQLLLITKDYMLIEHTPNDKFWGDGGDGNGQNKLGMLLMEIRFDLQNSRKLSRSSSVETATKPKSPPKVCREVLQKSASIENGSPIRSSGSSSSLMDQSNAATGVMKRSHDRDIVPQLLDLVSQNPLSLNVLEMLQQEDSLQKDSHPLLHQRFESARSHQQQQGKIIVSTKHPILNDLFTKSNVINFVNLSCKLYFSKWCITLTLYNV